MEVVVTIGAISRAKLQSNHHHQQTNIQFCLQAGCPSCRPTKSVKALKGKYHIPWTCLPHAHVGVFQLCLWPLIAPGYLGGGLTCLSSALWCQYRAGMQNAVVFKSIVTKFTNIGRSVFMGSARPLSQWGKAPVLPIFGLYLLLYPLMLNDQIWGGNTHGSMHCPLPRIVLYIDSYLSIPLVTIHKKM